jgi:hypothetical protein
MEMMHMVFVGYGAVWLAVPTVAGVAVARSSNQTGRS